MSFADLRKPTGLSRLQLAQDKMSLYSQYISERSNEGVIESDRGFATFKRVDEKTMYIIDIYVVPEHRKFSNAKKMADFIAECAKRDGCTRLLGSVVPSTNNATDSIKVLIAYGMSLLSSSDDLIMFGKDL